MKKFFSIFIFVQICFLAPVIAEEPNLALIDNLSLAFEQVSNKIRPSVVAITATKKAKKISSSRRGRPQMRQNPRSPFNDLFNDELFNRFFEQQIPDGGHSQQGAGSGVIVSKEGYILTNNHVVEGADEIVVTLSNEKKVEAKLIGTDPKSDVAVIQIETEDLVPASLGSSKSIKVGQWVVAAGSPFNLEQTITAGIVSAKGRSNVGIADYEDFIQTDAAINPGNSGGPLVNLRGEVIGINTAIFSKSGGYMGIGFSIPIDMAKNIMNSLIDNGEVVRGFIGVMIQKLDEDLAKSFNYKKTDGALVSEITKAGPADKAGIVEGDIIVQFNGEKVRGPSELKNIVGRTTPGKKVMLKAFRDGSLKDLYIVIERLEDEQVLPKEKEEIIENELGVDVSEITPEIQARMNIKDDNGVIVTYVDPSGTARANGIRRGDIILDINGTSISDKKVFAEAVSRINMEEGVRFTVKRSGAKIFMFIKE